MTAIEPPDYFPGLPYAALLITASTFVIDSRFQYSRQSHQNRARLRTPDGFQWISVPLTNGQHGRTIYDIQIDYDQNWVKQHLKALRFNYGSTPFFDHYIPEIEELLLRRPETLGSLTTGSVRLVHHFLNSPGELHVAPPDTGVEAASDPVDDEEAPVQRIQLEGRISARDVELARDHARMIRLEMPPYRQNFDGFNPGMSVLDLLFNHGPAAAGMLNRSVVTLTEHRR